MNTVGKLIKTYMFLCNKLIGVENEKAVFISFGGKYYSGNPKAISEKLHLEYPKMKIVWLFNNPKEKEKIIPDYVTGIKADSIKGLTNLATAKFWIDDCCKPLFMYKNKKQRYIQTWHGDRGFKKVVLDSPYISEKYKILESEKCDLMVSGSDYGDRKFKTAFEYHGDIIKYGCPRNDILIENSPLVKEVIRKRINIKDGTKVLLYAPTFNRDAVKENMLQSSDSIDLLRLLNILEERTNSDWICIVRAHSAVKGLDGIIIDGEKVLDGNAFEEMNELLLVSDFLITDYSSSAGDFALLNKPIVLFQPNSEQYIQKGKTLYFDLDNSPYMIARNNQNLIEIFQDVEWNTIERNCRDILDFYGTIETGEASKRVVKYMLGQLE